MRVALREGLRKGGMRVRITAVAASVVAVGLVVGALAFFAVLKQTLESNVQSLAHQDATSIALQIDSIDFEALQEMIDEARAAAEAEAEREDALDDDRRSSTQTPTPTPTPDRDDDHDDGDSESDGIVDDDSEREYERGRGDGLRVRELTLHTDELPRSSATWPELRVHAMSSFQSTLVAARANGVVATSTTTTTSIATATATAPPVPSPKPSSGPPGGGTIDFDTLLDRGDDRFVRILAASGDVVVSSTIPDDAAQFATARAHTSEFTGTDGQLTVLAGRSTAEMRDTLATVGGLLAVSVPLLALLVAITAWFVVGRAVRPVERMRRELDAVTASDLGRRVADPGTNDEIGRLAHTMNGMLDRLEDAQTAQRRFISDASHELKSPLASLRQYAEVAQAHPESIGADELTGAVLDEGARLEHLVHGMLVLARADEHALPLHRGEVDLDDLVFAEAQRLRELGRTSTPPLRVDSSGVVPVRVQGDAALLRQLVRNLADNAARHAHSLIRFELHSSRGRRGTDVVLLVCDDGGGIPPAERERVFHRFVRLDDARTRSSGGSGLGLAIVAEIAAAHGAGVRVLDGAPGTGGAVFELRMPQHPQPENDSVVSHWPSQA